MNKPKHDIFICLDQSTGNLWTKNIYVRMTHPYIILQAIIALSLYINAIIYNVNCKIGQFN